MEGKLWLECTVREKDKEKEKSYEESKFLHAIRLAEITNQI